MTNKSFNDFKGSMAFSRTTSERMAFSITTLSICDTQCQYAECRIFTIMLNAFVLSVALLSVVILNVLAPVSILAEN